MSRIIKMKATRIVATSAEMKEFGRVNAFEERLPFMSTAYKLSNNPKDYFMTPVLMFHSNVPNRNGYMFPTSSLVEWIPSRMSMAYETWRYAPLQVEHKADDPGTAIGVIADVAIIKEKGYSDDAIYKVIALAAVDRTKNVKLAADIEKGKRNSWSMGCDATRIFCSYCGQTQATVDDHGNVIGGCTHIDPNAGVVFYELNGKIVCRAASGLSGVELSSVGTPAFMMAVNNVNSIKGYS